MTIFRSCRSIAKLGKRLLLYKDNIMTLGFLKKATLLKRYEISESTFHRMCHDPVRPFPKPVALTPTSLPRWCVDDVVEWEANAQKSA